MGRFADEAFEPSLSLFPPPQRRRLALAGRRIMRAKQKDNSPIRGRRKSGQMGVKNSYLKMYLPSGSAVQGSRHPPGKLAVYPRFQPCVRPPPPTSLLSLLLLAALSGDVGTAVVGERATGFCKQLISPPTLPPAPCRCPPRVRVCLNTGGEGRVRGRRKPRVRFSRQPFQTFLGPLRAARGGEGRIAEKAPCRTPATLAVDSIVVDWTGSLELERVVVSLLRVFFLSFTFFLEREARSCDDSIPVIVIVVLHFARFEEFLLLFFLSVYLCAEQFHF